MPTHVLDRIRDLIRTTPYVVTMHAEEEMAEDDLSIVDLETAILTGALLEWQRDPKTRERKYLVRGSSLTCLQPISVVVKIGPTGKLVILTVYVG